MVWWNSLRIKIENNKLEYTFPYKKMDTMLCGADCEASMILYAIGGKRIVEAVCKIPTCNKFHSTAMSAISYSSAGVHLLDVTVLKMTLMWRLCSQNQLALFLLGQDPLEKLNFKEARLLNLGIDHWSILMSKFRFTVSQKLLSAERLLEHRDGVFR